MVKVSDILGNCGVGIFEIQHIYDKCHYHSCKIIERETMLSPLVILLNSETPSCLIACKPNKPTNVKTICHCCVILLTSAKVFQLKAIYVD